MYTAVHSAVVSFRGSASQGNKCSAIEQLESKQDKKKPFLGGDMQRKAYDSAVQCTVVSFRGSSRHSLMRAIKAFLGGVMKTKVVSYDH